MIRRAWPILAAAVALMPLAGCTPETRIVRYNPPLAGLPGAQTGSTVVRDLCEYQDPTAVAEDELERELPDGSKVLTAKTGRHLMIHIHNTLDRGERDLFTEQVLSKVTKAEYQARGMDPGQAFDTLLARRDDISRLFNMLPSGEFTPGVFARNIGSNTRRVEVEGMAARGLRWSGFDMVMEGGSYRLRWFVSPSRR